VPEVNPNPNPGVRTKSEVVYGISAADLIKESRLNPRKPIVLELIFENGNVVIHGEPEAFKTILSLHLAEALATGGYFLGKWKASRKHRVYFFETEMHTTAIGERVDIMFAGNPPDNLFFSQETEIRAFKRTLTIKAKMDIVSAWAQSRNADIVIVDTANPFFRGREKANEEENVGHFFDCFESIPSSLRICSRHNRRPRIEDTSEDGAIKIRGSGQWIDVPDFMMEMHRKDRRINQVTLTL
jgi:AAA domain